jgi:hypothetical protein
MKKPYNSPGFEWAYRDFLTMVFIVFLAFAVLASIKKTTVQTPLSGTLFISLSWDPKIDTDVDLWVQTPNDNNAIGYNHMSGIYCNLVRDDQGKSLDKLSNNSELIICRGVPNGDWTINAVMFNSMDYVFPTNLTLTVYKLDNGSQKWFEVHNHFDFNSQEITMLKFTTNNGNVTSSQINPPLFSIWGKSESGGR